MQQQFEDHYHRIEATHWWFVARRQAVHDLVVRSALKASAKILEIGCSGGLLMEQFRADGFTHVHGIDISEEGIELCLGKNLSAQVMDAQKLRFPDSSFDFITASDVLEHLEDERAALQEWLRVLKPGGTLLIFVPAFMFLWTSHDVVNKHYRRYRASELNQQMIEMGFALERSSYWNAILFPPIVMIRLLKLFIGGTGIPAAGGTGDFFVPPHALNKFLLWVVSLENRLLRLGVDFPIGVSVMAVGRKPVS